MSYDYKAKSKNVTMQNNYILAKTLSMFEWQNLPDTIPYKEIEKILQTKGLVFITEVNGELYALSGSLGGKVDAYNNPTEIVISNVGLNFNATLNINTDGVLILNDDMQLGLIPLLDRYNTFIVENDINMMMYGYNTRTQKLISASDDKTKTSAEMAVKKAIDGDIAVVGESAIFDGITVHSGSNNSGVSITNLTEYHQYIKGSLYNEIGLSANFNMKRERLTSGEVEVGEDANFPYVFNMLKNRIKGAEKLNEKYGLDINVDFGSVWAKGSKEVIDDVVEKTEVEQDGKKDLEDILKDPNSSDDDKQTARDLLDELEENANE